MNTKISIITPSVRGKGIDLVLRSLKRQTFKEFEWILIAPEETVIEWNPQVPLGLRYTWIEEPPKEKDNYWSLNKAMNKAIANAKGELIISWQDYTFTQPDCLEKFWFHYGEEPKTLVTGVGNKYQDDLWTVKTWQDPRERNDQGTFYPCFFNDIEFNLCSVPKNAFYAVGGYDEYLDRYAGMDGYSIVERLNLLGGWDFKIDQTNKSYSLEHGRLPHWEEQNALHGPYDERRKEYLKNPILPYLQTKSSET